MHPKTAARHDDRHFLPLFSLLFVWTVLALPCARGADLVRREINFDIPAQSLSGAILAFSAQTGLQVITAGTTLPAHETSAITGRQTIDTALTQLLDGTGLKYETIGQTTITLFPAQRRTADLSNDVNSPLRLVQAAGNPSGSASDAAGGAEKNVDKGSGETPAPEEIVVTARKYAERIGDVPMSVTAMSAETLVRRGATNFSDYLTAFPGVNFTSERQGQTTLVLRGITTGDSSNATVGTYVDETPFGSSSGLAGAPSLAPDLDPSDIDHIEVIRGPQGTLYGANSLGGVVKFVTAKPDPSRYTGRVQVSRAAVHEGGTDISVHGSANVPLIRETLALRFSGYDRNDPGYMSSPLIDRADANWSKVRGGRAALLWNVAPDLSAEFSGQWHDLDGRSDNNVELAVGTLQPLYGDLVQHRFFRETSHVRDHIYNATIRWDAARFGVVSSSSYSDLKFSGQADQTDAYAAVFAPLFGPDTGYIGTAPTAFHRFTQEVRVASPQRQDIEWQVGAFYSREAGNRGAGLFAADPATGAVLPLPSLFEGSTPASYRELSAFGNIDYHFNPLFDVVLGVRSGRDRQRYAQEFSGLLFGPAVVLDSSVSEHAFTYLINPRLRLDADNMLYGRVASGYRPGGPNAVPPTGIAAGVPTSFSPDNLTNYEIGWKAQFVQRTLSIDVALFYVDWNKVQLQESIQGVSVQANGGKARSDGLEGTVAWMPLDGLSFAANLSYTDTELLEDAANGSTDPARRVTSHVGENLPLVARWTWGLSADYDWHFSSNWRSYVGLSYRHVGRRSNVYTVSPSVTCPGSSVCGDLPPGDYENGVAYAGTALPSYETLDAHFGLQRGGWTVSGYVRNLTDERGLTGLRGVGFTADPPYVDHYVGAILQPRTVGAAIAFQF